MTQIGVAVDIPEPWGSFLTRCRAEAGDPQAADIPAHVTLLGPTEIPQRTLPAVEAHLAAVAAAHRPYRLHLRGTGTFRPVTQVVFVAVAAGISECELLAGAIRAAPGLDREMRFPYHPHVTIAHHLADPQLDRAFDELAGFDCEFGVDDFHLYVHDHVLGWTPTRYFALAPGT